MLAAVAIVVATLWPRHKGDTVTPDDSDTQSDIGVILAIDGRTEQLRDEDDGRRIIASHQDELGIADVEGMLGTCSVNQLAGSTYYRYDLEYEGVPIYGRSIVLVADQDSMLSAISSGALDMSACESEPAIDRDEAMESLAKETDTSSVYASELVFYAAGSGSPALAYRLSFVGEDEVGSFFISASDGSILGQTRDAQTLQGQGKDIHGSERQFEMASRLDVLDKGDEIPATSQGFYVLADMARNLYVYDAKGDDFDKVLAPMEVSASNGGRYHLLPAKTEPGYTWQDSQGNEVDVIGEYGNASSWRVRKSDGTEDAVVAARFSYEDHLLTSSATTVDAPSAVTLMSSLKEIYDFYADDATFSRKGFDGANGRVNAVCNVTLDNACAWAPAGSYAQVVCGKDHEYLAHVVIAHEFAHAVQGSICDFSGTGESGSIQEGTSDVLGVAACDYADNGKMDNSASWVLSVRNLVDPESMGNPSSYKQEGLWAETTPQYDTNRKTTNDSGGVHQNSTVLSHAAYLMCDKSSDIGGSTLTTTDVSTLVMSAFQMVSNADCDFAEFAGYMNCIAREKLGKDKSLRVEKAFEVVGIEPWLVALLDGKSESSPETEQEASENISRKLVTSFHMAYSSKKSDDYAYDEWVTASYDEQGRITRKEITRETSFGGWDGEPAYKLEFEYDTAGDLLHVTGVESPESQYNTKVNWSLGYEEGNSTLRASGTEGSDSRYINDTYDIDGNLVTRDYLIRTGQVLQNGTLTFSYDADGRISGQSARTGYNGDQSSMSGYETSVGYDESSRITSIEIHDSNGKLFSRRTYDYDDAGRVTHRNHFYNGGTSGLTVNQSCTYDENGHLVSVDQTGGDGWWAPAQAIFTTDEDGSIVSARIESENYTRTYEVEYVTIATPRGQEPFNAVDLTNPVNPELYNELWVSHANLDPTPYDESAFLYENRRWLELHEDETARQPVEQPTVEEDVSEAEAVAVVASPQESQAPDTFDGKKYWVVFTEGFRNGRIEASSFNVSDGTPALIWDENLTISDATLDGNVSQFRRKDDGTWEKIGEYGIPTDWALEVLASNVPIVDSSGRRIDVPSSY